MPNQLIVSQDESHAYVIASDRGSVLVFNIGNQTSSAIPLSGDAIPVKAALTPDGSRIYVAAADGQVHVLDTQTGGDILQTFVSRRCHDIPSRPVRRRNVHLQSGSDRGQTLEAVVSHRSSVVQMWTRASSLVPSEDD